MELGALPRTSWSAPPALKTVRLSYAPSPPQRLGHDLLAALAVGGVGGTKVAPEGGAQAVRGMAGEAPAARALGKLGPVFGVVRLVVGFVDLLNLGGVLGHE